MLRHDDSLVQRSIDEARGLATPDFADPAMAADFVAKVFHNAPQDAITGRTPAELAGIATSLWRLAADRKAGQAAIRVVQDGLAVQIINDDMRFLVNSIQSALAGMGLVVDVTIHPVLGVRRDAGGQLLGLDDGPDARRESMMHVALEVPVEPARTEAVVQLLHDVLAEVRACVEDWAAMRAEVAALADRLRETPHLQGLPEAADDAALLDWLDGNLLFLGMRHYKLDARGLEVVRGAGRGLLRNDEFQVFDGLRALTRASPDVAAFLRGPQPMMISKSNRRSPVHRPAPMDTVLVKLFDPQGDVSGLRLIVGLFTQDSYFRLPHEIPVLRQKVRRCHARAGFDEAGRDSRAFQHILDTFPRDEMFQIDETQLYETALGVMHLKQRPGLALFVLRDPFERFCTCLVYLPRDRFDAEAGRRIGAILEQAAGGRISHESTHFEDATLARLHYVIATQAGGAAIVVPEVERRLVEALRNWSDRLGEALAGEANSAGLMRRYAAAFPPSYRDRFDAAMALSDIGGVEAVLAGKPLAVALSSPADPRMRLRIFHPARPLALSDVLPMLENLGVRVISESAFEVTPREAEPVWVQELDLMAGRAAAEADAGARFEQAFTEVWSGVSENDGFNRLVLQAGLSAREVVVLRCICKLLRQAGSGFSQAYMEEALHAFPQIARQLVALFVLRADPALADDARTTQGASVHAAILESLEAVANLDDDRILRSFLLIALKTLRTNYFQRDGDGRAKPYLSMKIASREIDLLPQPRPLVEIFVYSPRMEGCHLRGGRVARGGIRWSDRREDFRTEVLGLMKAQMVKNAVIVPVGSKGGFVVKNPPALGGRDALMAEGIACYRMLMSGLLDLTDNIVGDRIVHPRDVVRHDADDTYLVVAADKGTATFSDIANAVSIEYGFWLGDAFASGGSVGYDHKVMGITAKGAWEAVKRHFREIGTDIQTQGFTCVGVGDMSGDVFGNAMMLSRQTRLVAAFNHMHVFIDPDPDPASSWAERVRLFRLPRSGWADYDAALLSKGGGVFERKAKSVALSPEIRALLGVDAVSMPPNELIQVLLRHDADLLFFGGIGTYVKASAETQAEAGDRANDALRISAPALRAKVIGEGANLGVTQRGRIEFALAGGRINTDAIDNSAGVDTSDHEVNIKIATSDVIAAGLVDAQGRTAFLASMTADVEALVLADNYLQTQALSLAEDRAAASLDGHAGLIRAMERAGRLDRAVEFLPDDEALAQRAAARLGLVRPEIAVLLAYAKMGLYDALLASDLPDMAEMHDVLLDYFPAGLRTLAPAALGQHRLRREIVATSVANSLVNRMGPSFVEDSQARTAQPPDRVARAFLIVRDVFGLPAIWRDIEALDNQVPAAVQTRLFHALSAIVEQAVRWFLLSGLALGHAEAVARFRPGVETLAASLVGLLPPPEQAVNAAREAAHVAAGVPDRLAARVVVLNTLSTAMDIVEIAESIGRDVTEVARLYFTTGAQYGLLLLRRQARAMPVASHWQRLAADALTDDSYVQQRQITSRLAARGAAAPEPGAALAEVLAEIGRTTPPDLAMLTVAARRIRTQAAMG